MRGVVVSGALFLIVVVFCICSSFALEKVGMDTCSILDSIQNNVEAEKWESALEDTEKLHKKWEKDIKWITILIDHRETDEIVQTLYALREYVKYRETPELMATAATLRRLFEHIPVKERLIIENIF